MTIAISDTHRQLDEVVASFAESHKLRGAARALLDQSEERRPDWWSEAAGLGWLGLHLPEDVGGSGFGLPELVVVVEGLGRALAPGPFLPTVTASAVIAAAGPADQRARWLPSLADGATVAGVGLSGTLRAHDGVVDGDGGGVLGAGLADLLLVVSGDDVVVVATGTPGVAVEVPGNLDPTRRSARVRFEEVDAGNVVFLAGAARPARAIARTLAAAEAAGGCAECTDMAVAYAKDRQQFGRVIGTFQAVKHICADMLVATELAAASVWDAARAASGDLDQFDLAASAAAAQSLPAYLHNAQMNIQVHGGIGFTWEHDGHLFLRRASVLHALVDPGAASEEVTTLGAVHHVVREHTLELPPEAEEIRADVRRFAEEVKDLPEGDRLARMIETGYVQPHWPRPFGREAEAVEQLVIDEEFARAGVPHGDYGITGWIILTLIQKATPEQVERWVPPTLRREYVWCQLFSEPNAGSDAAGIRTRGVRTDGGFLVTGQKVWTSGAQIAQRGLATIRTDPDAPKHAGITTVVIDMGAEGVEVRPLREATGNAMFNEVFFDDVFVSDEDVVGPVNGGWAVARSTLGNERVSIGRGGVGSLLDLADLYRRYGERIPGSARPVGELLAEGLAMAALNLRAAERAIAGGEPGPEGNVTKLLSATHVQRISDLALALVGPDVALSEGDGAVVGLQLLFSRALSIAGGTSEITRNQIAERILGLPRDPLLR
ncbi:MAG TPA: acyl-CoA dehydrogenase [Acidimicrobiales bacterium]|nr:acyl-CoA dehydrogenase [Acidimicrobiales bacterium]